MLPKSIMDRVSEGYENVWKAFIKPTPFSYDIGQLGPSIFFTESGRRLQRVDFTVTNPFYKKLHCSLYLPEKHQERPQDTCCVVYLHSQSGCRVEGLSLRDFCAEKGYALCMFDFAGCGMSEGEYVSLGYHEKNDLRIVLDEIRGTFRISRVCLWGRSMGAVTAVLFGEINRTQKLVHISSMVLDSPFTDINSIAQDVAEQNTSIPTLFVSMAMAVVKSTIRDKLQFDIDDLKPLESLSSLNCPIAFHVGKQDVLVRPYRVRQYFDLYKGNLKKTFLDSDCDHGGERSESVIRDLFKFVDDKFMEENHRGLDIETNTQVSALKKAMNKTAYGTDLVNDDKGFRKANMPQFRDPSRGPKPEPYSSLTFNPKFSNVKPVISSDGDRDSYSTPMRATITAEGEKPPGELFSNNPLLNGQLNQPINRLGSGQNSRQNLHQTTGSYGVTTVNRLVANTAGQPRGVSTTPSGVGSIIRNGNLAIFDPESGEKRQFADQVGAQELVEDRPAAFKAVTTSNFSAVNSSFQANSVRPPKPVPIGIKRLEEIQQEEYKKQINSRIMPEWNQQPNRFDKMDTSVMSNSFMNRTRIAPHIGPKSDISQIGTSHSSSQFAAQPGQVSEKTGKRIIPHVLKDINPRQRTPSVEIRRLEDNRPAIFGSEPVSVKDLIKEPSTASSFSASNTNQYAISEPKHQPLPANHEFTNHLVGAVKAQAQEQRPVNVKFQIDTQTPQTDRMNTNMYTQPTLATQDFGNGVGSQFREPLQIFSPKGKAFDPTSRFNARIFDQVSSPKQEAPLTQDHGAMMFNKAAPQMPHFGLDQRQGNSGAFEVSGQSQPGNKYSTPQKMNPLSSTNLGQRMEQKQATPPQINTAMLAYPTAAVGVHSPQGGQAGGMGRPYALSSTSTYGVPNGVSNSGQKPPRINPLSSTYGQRPNADEFQQGMKSHLNRSNSSSGLHSASTRNVSGMGSGFNSFNQQPGILQSINIPIGQQYPTYNQQQPPYQSQNQPYQQPSFPQSNHNGYYQGPPSQGVPYLWNGQPAPSLPDQMNTVPPAQRKQNPLERIPTFAMRNDADVKKGSRN